jgi:hypothetical protein
MILNLWDANEHERYLGAGREDVYLGTAVIPLADASTNLR